MSMWEDNLDLWCGYCRGFHEGECASYKAFKKSKEEEKRLKEQERERGFIDNFKRW